VLKELFSSTKRIVIKIIPHRSASIYKLELSHRHAAMVVGAAVLVACAIVTFQVGAVHAAEARLRTLQAADAQQHQQLIAFSRKTQDILRRLTVLQRNERDIKRIAGISTEQKKSVTPKVARPVHLAQHEGPTQMSALWSRMRSWLAGGSDGTSMTFAAESSELAMLDVQLNQALTESAALKARAVASAQAREQALLARQRYLDAIPSMWPTDGYISSGFGYRSYPDSGFHTGLDIVNYYGAPVLATAAGTVVEAGWDGGFGIKIAIDHGNGYVTWYAHNSAALVSIGQFVHKGQQIADLGSTGFATGPHVHYEVHVDGRPVDPVPFLSGSVGPTPAQLAAIR
jgi:murein DD-endopeptidase MepM/ murein hydrolase activator NlpD